MEIRKMLNRIIFLFCIFISFCSCRAEQSLDIGDSIPYGVQNQINEKCYTLLNSATILPLYYYSKYISIGGTDGIIEFIKDETPDKVISGMKIGDKIIVGSDFFKKIYAEIGVGFYIPIEDGWNAFIGDANTDEENFEVMFFFKKKLCSAASFLMNYEEYKIWLEKINFNQ